MPDGEILDKYVYLQKFCEQFNKFINTLKEEK